MDKLESLLGAGKEEHNQQKELAEALSQSAEKRSKQLSRPKQMKPLALERGLIPDKEHPGFYRDPKRPEFLFNGTITVVNEEEMGCWACHDARYVKMAPPATRPSKGAWDSELVPCDACGAG